MSQTTSDVQQQQQQEYIDDIINLANTEDHDQLTLRSLVSTKEAGVIIGKAGKTIAEIRDKTGVKSGISKIVQGIPDSVLTVTGTLEGVATAYSLIAKSLLDNHVISSSSLLKNNTSIIQGTAAAIRLLISHNLMGTIIGREGKKIKSIQDETGVKIVASKTLLSQSTERVVEVCGDVEGIRTAILDIGQCLMNDKERAFGTILYNPLKAIVSGDNPYIATNNNKSTSTHRRVSISNGNGYNGNHHHNNGNNYKNMNTINGSGRPRRFSNQSQSKTHYDNNNNNSIDGDVDIQIYKKSYPSDLVGPIIGKAGSKISEIRQLSNTRIAIAKVTDNSSGEREFSIQGSSESIQQAIVLIDEVVKKETERRLKSQTDLDDSNTKIENISNNIDEIDLKAGADSH
ncbi:unnamed protein product [Cunninghamella blakesleeana]